MIDAWNRGSGEGFAAPFSETADFIAFEGTHLKGRKAIAAFHQQAFDTVVKGTRLEGEVNFVHFLNPQLALMNGVVRVGVADSGYESTFRLMLQNSPDLAYSNWEIFHSYLYSATPQGNTARTNRSFTVTRFAAAICRNETRRRLDRSKGCSIPGS
ncbi:SgcJ/EcaC family oxidoreductase [Microcoleus sp. BROC3]|uniref:SgcJ/EcaC family oxidoreductase n=1 Tax=Microcoleus sp. BROC3 TaxID=3055323 RepID=UPI002FD09E32